MTKLESAGYLYTLHSLMQAQSSGPNGTVSPWLAREYEREWDVFKELVRKDQENEARNRELSPRRTETGTDQSGSITGRSIPDRDSRGHGSSR